MTLSLPLGVQQAIDETARRWNDYPSPHLRLYSLRKLARFLHAEKSRILANPEAGYGPAVDQLEERLDWIRDTQDCRNNDLGSLLLTSPIPPPPLREYPLPAAFPSDVADKFQQYDRRWELAILSEALLSGWIVAQLDCWTEVTRL